MSSKPAFIALFSLFVFSGCVARFDQNGQLRSLLVARNEVYADNEDGSSTGTIDTTSEQTGTIGSVFNGFFETIEMLLSGILPRGFAYMYHPPYDPPLPFTPVYESIGTYMYA